MGISSVKIKSRDLPATLKEMRLSFDLSQEDVAQMSGLATATISHYETGRRIPNEDYLNRLLAVYGFKLDTLTLRVITDEKE
jgi:transcriptional regulator with XRE-family HTH domain